MTSTGFNISGNREVSSREDEGTAVPVRNELGEPQFFGEGDARKPVTIRVAGTYSNVYRRAVDAQRDRLLKMRRTSLTGDQLARQQLDLIAACVLGWEGILSGTAPVPFTKENAVELLDAAPWIREDVESAMNDHQSFSKPAAPGS